MKGLRFYQIAFIYVGVIMGAGFASGRECWQFFAIFGNKSYYSVWIFVLMFPIINVIISYIARNKNTTDYTEILSPSCNPLIKKIINFLIGFQYFIIQIVMTAAGGSLLYQQFSISKVIGGVIIALLAAMTVLGEFDRISKVFTKITPLLLAFVFVTVICVIASDFEQSGAVSGFDAGDLTPNCVIAGILYLSYNTIGLITVGGDAALKAKDSKHAYIGAFFGALCMGLLILVMIKAILSDMSFTDANDLPLLAYAGRINPVLNISFAIVLYFAIYSSAASTLYGLYKSLPKIKHDKLIMFITPFIAFILGLTGFTKLVQIVYPIMGYISIILLLLMIINFFKELSNK